MHINQEKYGAENQSVLQARDFYEKGIRLSIVKPSKSNLKKAVEYFTKAADLGHLHSNFIIGDAFCKGKWQTELDQTEAIKYLETAALNKHPEAMMGFAELHHKNGNLFDALDEYLLALSYGNQAAIDSIQGLINNPLGQNYLESLFKREEQENDSLVQYFIARCYLHGFCTEPNLERAIGWLKESVREKNGYAAHTLGYLYETGTGVEKDLDMAIDLYKIAGENGFSKGYLSIAINYSQRTNTPQQMIIKENLNTAFKYYEKAAALGDLVADNEMGILHIQGLEFDFPNYLDAVACFQAGADKGNPDAILNLANCYYSGCGVARDLSKAESLFSSLLSHDDDLSGQAALGLGAIYLKSIDKRTRKIGRRYLETAAKAGIQGAQELLNKSKK